MLNNNIKNISNITEFLYRLIPESKITKEYKITCNCPYCTTDNNKHLIINIDWNNFKCYKCGTSGSISKLCKEFNVYKEYFNFIKSNTKLSKYLTYSYIKNIDSNVKSIKNKKIEEFISKNSLFNIKKVKTAYEYALERTMNNKLEISNYLANDNTIFIPIVENGEIIAYLGRKYNLDPNKLESKYFMEKINSDINVKFAFIDEVMNEIDTDDLYLCEGYFDSYAINYSMNKYCSLCLFGKTIKHEQLKFLQKNIPLSTNIILVLDSCKQSKRINKYILENMNKIKKYFNRIFVVSLPETDPNDILVNKGSDVLIKYLTKYKKTELLFKVQDNFTF